MAGEDKQRTWTGYSGQLALMAELLFRRCNVAVPVVDRGTDLFAFLDEGEVVTRVQVKTGQGVPYKREEGYSVQFQIPMKQLRQEDEPPLFYALVSRVADRFADFLIVSRAELKTYWGSSHRFGTSDSGSGNLVLTVQFRPGQVLCSEIDLTEHRNAWARLPVFHMSPVAAEEAPAGEAGDVGG